MPPRSVLQVFRVLQEAMTNALKHSDGNRIEVLVERDAISVLDNGSRFEGPRAGGRGLENMATRATAVGGEFSMERRDGWTIARIALPTVGASTPEAAD
jgi:signal transduction histidine kinase